MTQYSIRLILSDGALNCAPESSDLNMRETFSLVIPGNQLARAAA
jgi:hypothetical protein